jgi:glycosyltransferase involved in cell wall biosynthesis
MNIVQVVRSLELGGLERVALDLATAQKEAGNCVSIYSVYKHEPALIHEADRAGLRVIQFNKLTGFSIRTLWNMARQLRRDQASIVHTHNELVHTYGTIAGRLAGVPCIVNTIHGTKAGKGFASRSKLSGFAPMDRRGCHSIERNRSPICR